MLTKDTVQAIVNYLQTKPYGEVFQLIAVIMREAKPDSAAAPQESAE